MSSVPSIFTSPKKVQKSVRKVSGFRTLFRQHCTRLHFMYSDFPHLRVLLSPNAVHAAVRYIFLSGYFFAAKTDRFSLVLFLSFVFLLFFFCFSVFYLCLTCICSWNFPAASITLNAAIDSKIQFPACSNCRKNNPIMTRLSTHQIRRAR